MITITGVRLSPDQKVAHVTVSVLPAEKQSLTLHGLKSAAAHIRRVAGETVRTRHMPEIHFHLDETLKKQAEVMASIAKAAQERARREAGPRGPAYADDLPPEGTRS
jgi:ribosome-binding factor A